jgi:hypothetical protein
MKVERASNRQKLFLEFPLTLFPISTQVEEQRGDPISMAGVWLDLTKGKVRQREQERKG